MSNMVKFGLVANLFGKDKDAERAKADALRQRDLASISQQQAQQASQDSAAEAAGQYSAAKNVRGRRLLLGDGASLAEA